MKTATEITANAIYKVTTKATGQTCYAVPSDSTPGAYYITCFDEKSTNWTCTCKAGEIAAHRGQSANCKHARAAQTSIIANKERIEAERQAYLAECEKLIPVLDAYLATEEGRKDAESDEDEPVQPLSREAYQDLFDPCTIPGMY